MNALDKQKAIFHWLYKNFVVFNVIYMYSTAGFSKLSALRQKKYYLDPLRMRGPLGLLDIQLLNNC